VPPYDAAIEISSNGRPKAGRFALMDDDSRFAPTLLPMEALSVDEVPKGKNWQYEPKWDGFRCLVFRDGRKVELQSKSGQSLTHYFPELVAAVAALKAKRFVLDGEIVVPRGQAFSFDDLLQRIHPAESRVEGFVRKYLRDHKTIRLSPVTAKIADAQK